MSHDFYDQQASIHQEIISALIDAAPHEWRSAVLEVEVDPTRENERCAHLIYSPEEAEGGVHPTERLCEATGRLVTLFQSQQPMWRRATFGVWQSPQRGWESMVQMTY